MSKQLRFNTMAGLAMLGICGVGVQSQGAVVYMNMSALSTPTEGIAAFDGTHIVSLGSNTTIDTFAGMRGFAPDLFNDAHMVIAVNTFTVGQATVRDLTNNGVGVGDTVTAPISAGDFSIVTSSGGVIVSGHFNSAVLSATLGSSSVTISSSSSVSNGLTLTPGPVLTSIGYTAFSADESFALGLVGINPGVQLAGAATRIGTSPLYKGTIAPFGVAQPVPTSGSLDLVANMVPEPTSLGMLGLGAMALLARRRGMKKIVPSVLAAAGLCMIMGGGTKAEAAIAYMNFSDISNPTNGLAGYVPAGPTGQVSSLGDADTFTISGAVSAAFLGSHFEINPLAAFDVTDTILEDANSNGVPNIGELVTSTVSGMAPSGSYSFRILNASNVELVRGTFDSATLSTSVGSHAVTIGSSDVTGLSLTPGPALTALGITAFNPVESFTLNIVGITPGIFVSNLVPVDPSAPDYYYVNLAGYSVGQQLSTSSTSGSVDLVANAVIPEPASLGLLGVGAAGLIARRRRQA